MKPFGMVGCQALHNQKASVELAPASSGAAGTKAAGPIHTFSRTWRTKQGWSYTLSCSMGGGACPKIISQDRSSKLQGGARRKEGRLATIVARQLDSTPPRAGCNDSRASLLVQHGGFRLRLAVQRERCGHSTPICPCASLTWGSS